MNQIFYSLSFLSALILLASKSNKRLVKTNPTKSKSKAKSKKALEFEDIDDLEKRIKAFYRKKENKKLNMIQAAEKLGVDVGYLWGRLLTKLNK